MKDNIEEKKIRKEFEEKCWRKYGQTFDTLCDGGSSGLLWPLVLEALTTTRKEAIEECLSLLPEEETDIERDPELGYPLKPLDFIKEGKNEALALMRERLLALKK